MHDFSSGTIVINRGLWTSLDQIDPGKAKKNETEVRPRDGRNRIVRVKNVRYVSVNRRGLSDFSEEKCVVNTVAL